MNTRGKGRTQNSGTEKPAGKRTFVKTTAAKRKPEKKGDDSFSDRKPKNPRSQTAKKTGSKQTSFRRESSADKPQKKFNTRGEERGKSETLRMRKHDDSKPFRRESASDKPYRRTGSQREETYEKRGVKEGKRKESYEKRPTGKINTGRDESRKESRFSGRQGTTGRWSGQEKREERKKARKEEAPQKGTIRLNRFIANAGICSRREADDLIMAGLVTVNGASIVEMGYQVKPTDDVRYNGERLSREKKVYILLNKPKDAITTVEDPDGRRTVMQLFGNELGERIYPVGRLDRNTTGVLLFTNDGDLAQRLMHPRYEMKKVYKAILDKGLKGEDMWQLTNGVELEDGFIKPDAVAYPNPKDKKEIGIEIHSGKNRIIHRIFESLGYKVDKLDRVLYAGLTKGKLKRGEWRELTEKEVSVLKRTLKLS